MAYCRNCGVSQFNNNINTQKFNYNNANNGFKTRDVFEILAAIFIVGIILNDLYNKEYGGAIFWIVCIVLSILSRMKKNK